MNNFSYLKEQLQHLSYSILNCNGIWESEMIELIHGLSSEEKYILAKIRKDIEKRNDLPHILRWIASDNETEIPFKKSVASILLVLQKLKDFNIKPFCDFEDTLIEIDDKLPWKSLPSSLRYICRPAEIYGQTLDEEAIQRKASSLSNKDLNILNCLGMKIKNSGDYKAILTWLKDPLTKQGNETRCMLALLMLFGALDIDIE